MPQDSSPSARNAGERVPRTADDRVQAETSHFEARIDQIADLLDRKQDIARLAQEMLDVQKREALAGDVASALLEKRKELEGEDAFRDLYAHNGHDLRWHLVDQVRAKLNRQITDETKRTDLAHAIAVSVLQDPGAQAEFMKQYKDLPWKSADPAAISRSLEARILQEFERQALDVQKQLKLKGKILDQKKRVKERVSEQKGIMGKAFDTLKAGLNKVKNFFTNPIVLTIIIAILVYFGVYYLLEWLKALHGQELLSAAQSLKGTTEAGAALHPTTGLTGPGSALMGGGGGAPLQENLLIDLPPK